MHTRTATTATALLAAGLLALTACSSSSSGDSKATATTSTPAPTPTATYNPAVWKTRIDNLVDLMDQNQTECNVAPSSEDCNNILRAADSQMLEMKAAIDANGGAASHPATADILGKILDGYNSYISGSCPGGDETADTQGSDCRVSMVTVMLGVATLSSKMTLDGDQ
ncbi:hypothetical protein V2S66_31295 [Streptomyces sp. V4-01]|uniref:Lipoprotein n=1 Tax=Actinacidiphila polyblastidii TaxID=3110430 RepID=A0ABU7PKS2_9ACTN|nr:hypothetical protein [Streptomyces sp. V4-01]